MSDGYSSEEDVGFHFEPSEQETIDIINKKERGEACGDFIVEKDVYGKEPWLLDHTKDPFFKEDEWFYFSTRNQVSEQKIGCGKRVKRKITGDNKDGIDHGYWKLNGKKDIIDEKTKKIIGVNQSLTFTHNNNKKKQKIGYGASASAPGSEYSWIMNEYVLPGDTNFQKLVLCKIKKKKNPKMNDNEASTSSTCQKKAVNEAHHHQYPEMPRKGSMSSEKEKNMDQWVEESMIHHQVDAFLLKKKNEKGEAMEGQKHVVDYFPTKRIMDWVSVPDRLNAPHHVRLGENSLPIELDKDNEEDEDVYDEDFFKFLKLIEDAPDLDC